MEKKPRYAVLGYPLEHTLSPALHKKLFALSKIEAEYTAISISPQDFADRAVSLFELDGFNITMPYKQQIIPYLDCMTEEAMRFRAVNTVAVRPTKKIGHNTDIYGVLKSFELLEVSFKGSLCIAGAGATAGMIATEAVRQGGNVTLAVRASSVAKGEALADSLRKLSAAPEVAVIPLESLREPFDVLINATPCGMYPDITGCPFKDETIRGAGAVFDLIYNPTQTMLCAKAEAMGKRVLNGLPMLVWQAACAHQFWYNAQFTDADIRTIVDETRLIL